MYYALPKLGRYRGSNVLSKRIFRPEKGKPDEQVVNENRVLYNVSIYIGYTFVRTLLFV